MKCPHCKKDKGSRVIRTQNCSDGVNRERVCFGCHFVYTSTESVDRKQKDIGNGTIKKTQSRL